MSAPLHDADWPPSATVTLPLLAFWPMLLQDPTLLSLAQQLDCCVFDCWMPARSAFGGCWLRSCAAPWLLPPSPGAFGLQSPFFLSYEPFLSSESFFCSS